MFEDMIQEIQNMSAEEQKALLETEFPEELEKQAEAELATAELADALYTYGWLSAERAVAEFDGLDKIASEDLEAHEQAEAGVGEAIETALESLGTAANEDEIALHKEAQVAAAIIFEGYSDAMEKIAKGKGADHVAELAKMMKKHKGKAAGAAGLMVGLGGGALSKKASDMTVAEIKETIEGTFEIENGINKLAGGGAAKGKSVAKAIKEKVKGAVDAVKKTVSSKGGSKGSSKGKGKGGILAHLKENRAPYSGAAGMIAGAAAGRAIAKGHEE